MCFNFRKFICDKPPIFRYIMAHYSATHVVHIAHSDIYWDITDPLSLTIQLEETSCELPEQY